MALRAHDRSAAARRSRCVRRCARRLRRRPRLRAARARRCRPPTRKRRATGDAVWLPAAPADALERGDWWRLFGDRRARPPRGRGRGLEPERRRRGRGVSPGAGARARSSAPRCFPTVGARRRRARVGGGDGRLGATGSVATTFSAALGAELGARRLGPPRPHRRGRARRARRRARPTSPRRACRRRASSPPTTSRCARPTPRSRCCAQRSRLRARAADHAEPLRRRRRRQDRRAAGADAAGERARDRWRRCAPTARASSTRSRC